MSSVPIPKGPYSLTIDQMNIALMLMACVAAYFLPFEILLFSYAFLEPAHYLTQLSWMHDRKYFTDHKWLWVPATAIVILLMLLGYEAPLPQNLKEASNYIIYSLAFAGAASLILIHSVPRQIIMACVLVTVLLVFKGIMPAFALPLILLIPTVLHIYVFTGAFILHGAMKNDSLWGFLSFAVFAGCGLFFLCVRPDPVVLLPSYSMNNVTFFDGPAAYLQNLLSFSGPLDSIAIFSFLGFAYTYHYLNWFSKVQVIQWNKIPRTRFAALCLVYCISIALYLYDFRTGFIALFFLSMLHVVLEFPLNALTFHSIGKTAWTKMTGKAGRNA